MSRDTTVAALVKSAHDYADSTITPGVRAEYGKSFARFQAWCKEANGNPIGANFVEQDPSASTLAQVANLIAADLGTVTGQQGTPTNTAVPALGAVAAQASAKVKAP